MVAVQSSDLRRNLDFDVPATGKHPEANLFDVIIVLGTPVDADGKPSPTMRRRVTRGIELYRQGRARRLLFTGGLGRPPEAAAMRDLALDADIPDEHIILEPTATTTLENAVRSSRLMSEQAFSSALIVSDRFHLPRALLVFRCLGIRAKGAGVAAWLPGPLRTQWRYPLYEACAFIWYVAMILARRHRRKL